MFRFLRRFAFRAPAPPAPRERALAALARGEFGQAEAALGELLAQGPELGERVFLLNKRGVARVGAGRPEQAHEDFTAAIELRAEYAPALTNLGNLCLEAGDVERAIARYLAAIAADDEYVSAHLNLGIAYKRAGRTVEGIRELRRAASLERWRARRRARQ